MEIVSSSGDSGEVQKRVGGHIPVEGGGEVGLTVTVKGDEEGELTAEGNRDFMSTVSQSLDLMSCLPHRVTSVWLNTVEGGGISSLCKERGMLTVEGDVELMVERGGNAGLMLNGDVGLMVEGGGDAGFMLGGGEDVGLMVEGGGNAGFMLGAGEDVGLMVEGGGDAGFMLGGGEDVGLMVEGGEVAGTMVELTLEGDGGWMLG